MSFEVGNRLIVPLDVPTLSEADALVATLAGAASWMKIGLELYTAEGPEAVRCISATGASIMLDLKLHDIPATVAGAMRRVAALGVGLVTVHAGGGRQMLEAAVAAAGDTRVLAVTVLTSMDADNLREVGVAAAPRDAVLLRAQLAIEAGCHGVVASPLEAAAIREIAPAGFLIVTPGVRPSGADVGDQKRVMTPAQARAAGADMVVVGRPIRSAADPAAAARAVVAELGDQ